VTIRVRIRLIKKLSNLLNGVDLSQVAVGNCFDLPAREARMLIYEGWAEQIENAEMTESKPEKA
jgi:hypothetical protein